MGLPRVTEIISPLSDYTHIMPDVLEYMADRGSRVHAICSKILLGKSVDDESIDEDCQPFVDSFRQWVMVANPEALCTERRFEDRAYGYHGTPDLICRIGDDVWLLDIKTSQTLQAIFQIQLSAYHHLVKKEHTIKRLGILQLFNDGAIAKVTEYKWELMGEAFAVFISLLNVKRWSEKWQIKKSY